MYFKVLSFKVLLICDLQYGQICLDKSLISLLSFASAAFKEIKSIKKPREFTDILEKYVDTQRDKYGTRGRDILGFQPHEHDDEICGDNHDDTVR